MRTILTTLFMTVATHVAAFEYKEVFRCSRFLDLEALDIKVYQAQQDFHIHFGEGEKVVIYHLMYQFSNFETRYYDHLYVQNGATTKLEITQSMGDLRKFELHRGKGLKTSLIVDFSDLTYISRVSSENQIYEPQYGTCKRVVGK